MRPDDCKYLDTHEWARMDGDLVVVGITDFAVEELSNGNEGDLVYVDMPDIGREIEQGETFGEIESVKATSALYCGIAGEVVEVNQAVVDNPALVNDDPFGEAWIIKVKPADPSQVESLKAAADYDADHG